MITSKQEYASFCQHIHHHITAQNQSIKLGSLRERVASAFHYRTVSALLSDLPVELSSNFIPAFLESLRDQHRVTTNITLASFPLPVDFPLSDSEKELFWRALVSKTVGRVDAVFLSFSGITPESLATSSAPQGFSPDGSGGWYCEKHSVISENIESISIKPTVLFPLELATTELANQIAANIKNACMNFWSNESSNSIYIAVAALFRESVDDENGMGIDVSHLLSTKLKDAYPKLKRLTSSKLNKLAGMNSLFLPYSISRRPTSFEDRLLDGLAQNITGNFLLHDKSEETEASFWEPLSQVQPCSEYYLREREKFYKPFIYSEAFMQALRNLAVEWVSSRKEWNLALENLAVIPIESSSAECNRYYRLTETTMEQVSDSDLTVWISPFSRSQDEFGYHDDEPDVVPPISEFVDFDEKMVRADLQQDIDDEANLEAIIEDIEAEALATAEEAYYDAKEKQPFVSPFVIEKFALDRVNKNDETELVIAGTYFSELASVSSLGRHYDLMDSLTRGLSKLSSFIKQFNEQFNGVIGDVFFIEDLFLTRSFSPESFVRTLILAFNNADRYLEDTVIIIDESALTDSYFIGAPYGSSGVLQERYESFVRSILDELEPHCLECHYIFQE